MGRYLSFLSFMSLYCPSFFDYQLFDIFELFLGHSCFRRFMFGIMIWFIHAYIQSFNLLNKHLSNINYRIFISYKSFNKSGQRRVPLMGRAVVNPSRVCGFIPSCERSSSPSFCFVLPVLLVCVSGSIMPMLKKHFGFGYSVSIHLLYF